MLEERSLEMSVSNTAVVLNVNEVAHNEEGESGEKVLQTYLQSL